MLEKISKCVVCACRKFVVTADSVAFDTMSLVHRSPEKAPVKHFDDRSRGSQNSEEVQQTSRAECHVISSRYVWGSSLGTGLACVKGVGSLAILRGAEGGGGFHPRKGGSRPSGGFPRTTHPQLALQPDPCTVEQEVNNFTWYKWHLAFSKPLGCGDNWDINVALSHFIFGSQIYTKHPTSDI